MKRTGNRRWVAAGLLLCALTLALSVALQRAGYLTYLNGDMASEMILARRQADTGSLVQMDWLYSTEIHTLHMNLLYALAFLVTPSFETARIIGNTLGFLIAMGSLVCLLRALRFSWGASLCAAALLPVAAGTLYATNVTIGGYYIVHFPFAFFLAALWLTAPERGRGRTLAFAALCALEGFLSVRYVLCFVCPMLAVAVLDALFARDGSEALPGRLRFLAVTALGFAACVLGYAASEVLLPRLFVSGTGGAGTFRFNPLDGAATAALLWQILTDLLKLFGWRGAAGLFSAGGMVNLCAAGVMFLGAALLVRALRGAGEEEATRRARRRLLLLAAAAFFVNIFCFLFIEGTYLNRYLVLAAYFFIPALPVVLAGERNLRLKGAFLAALCAWLGLAAPLLLAETRAAQPGAAERAAGMEDAADYLLGEGYTHGYGTFWNVRVMQERTDGALTFTGVVPSQTEEGALVACAPDFIRWLEPDEASDLDACEGKTFLILTRAEEAELSDWLALCAAPLLHENADYAVYGFDSSEEFCTAALLGRATLEQGDAELSGGALRGVTLKAGGRLRMPPGWREAGGYVLRFTCEGEPAADSEAVAYTGKGFDVLAQRPIAAGENALAFTLHADDKYFMLQLRAGGANGLRLTEIRLEKTE